MQDISGDFYQNPTWAASDSGDDDDDESVVSSSTIMDAEIPTISEDDLLDLEDDIMSEIDDYVRSNVFIYSSPLFYEIIRDNVVHCIYDGAVNSDLCDDIEANRTEITQYVEDSVHRYFYDIKIMTPRSYPRNTGVIEFTRPSFEETEAIIDLLRNMPQPAQRTQEWYEYRYNLITASNIYKALGTESQRNSLIYEKCKPLFISSGDDSLPGGARGWGQKYEPVTAMIYESMYPGNKVDTSFGCIRHREYSFIGASPDGIVVSGLRYGHMIEIKNTVSREITDTPIESHWIQCQVQMEVCDLPYCDYFQTSIKEITWDEFVEDQLSDFKGVILHVCRTHLEECGENEPTSKYIYMKPLQSLDFDTKDELTTVVNSWVVEIMAKEYVNYHVSEIFYWKLEESSCVVIPRNREWFQSALPQFQAIWSQIEHDRQEGYEHRAPKKRSNSSSISPELVRSYQVSLLSSSADDASGNESF